MNVMPEIMHFLFLCLKIEASSSAGATAMATSESESEDSDMGRLQGKQGTALSLNYNNECYPYKII